MSGIRLAEDLGHLGIRIEMEDLAGNVHENGDLAHPRVIAGGGKLDAAVGKEIAPLGIEQQVARERVDTILEGVGRKPAVKVARTVGKREFDRRQANL